MSFLGTIDGEDLTRHGVRNYTKDDIPADPLHRRDMYVSIVSRFTRKQKHFLWAFIHLGDVKAAAEQVDINNNLPYEWEKKGVQWRMAYDIATVDPLMSAWSVMEESAVKAVNVIADLLDSPDPKIRLQAANSLAKMMADSKVKKVEHSGNVGMDMNVEVTYKDTLMKLVEGQERLEGNDPLDAMFREVLPDEDDEEERELNSSGE